MNSLSSDELAAILALGNLTENRIDANAEIISTSHSSRKSEPENESDYDNDEDDDDDEDDDNSDCEDDSSSGFDLSISVEGISPVSDNTEQCIEETVKKMRSVCSESLMIVLRERLDTIIRRVCVKSYLSASTFLKNIMKDNDDIHLQFLEEIADKEFLFKMEVLLKATVVYFLSLQMVNTHDEMDSVDELLKEYSQYLHFAECADDAEEAQYILCYRNYMKKALCIIPAKRNKLLLVNVCSLLEGSRRTYITGGTQSSATTRRIVVYEHESGYRKKCRPKRRLTSASSASSSSAAKKKSRSTSMEMVTCSCGAVIRKRTLWKHHRSKKHQRFLHPIPASSSADSKTKPKAAKSAKQKFKVRAPATANSIKPQRPPLYLPQCQPVSAPPAIHTLPAPAPAPAGPHFHPLSELQLSHLVAHNVHNMGGRSPSPLELSVNNPFPPEQSLQYLVPHHGGPQNYSLPPYDSSATTTTNTSASLLYDCHSHPYLTQLQPASASASASEMYQQQLSMSSISLSPRLLPYAQLYSQVQSFPLFCATQGALSSSNPTSTSASASASRLVHVIQVDPRYVYQLPPSWM